MKKEKIRIKRENFNERMDNLQGEVYENYI